MRAGSPRIIYLSSTDLGVDLLHWLQKLPCNIILAKTDNQKISAFPDYDLGISFLYTHRIPSAEFHHPYKWVNFHPGPLPEFRGRNLAYHAIMEESPYFGATIHYMDCDFDTGEIIEVVRFPIMPHHTAGDLVAHSYLLLSQLFKTYMPELLKGKIESRPQGDDGRYFRRVPIDDKIELTEQQARKIRAVTVDPRFHARVNIGGKLYKLVPVQDDSQN